MPSATTYYCWSCYAPNPRGEAPCEVCGEPVQHPPGVTYTEELLWALGHPLPGRQMIAAQVLGQRRERAAEAPLRALVRDADPFLAAQALSSLVVIVGADALRGMLEDLARSGSPAVSRIARQALGDVG